MKTLTSICILFLLAGALASGQTATPSTTLCAATTATAKSVCLTAVTHVVNQTGLYIDNEYMVVTLSSAQTIAAGGYVPVQRGAGFGGGPPAAHGNGATAWLALTPGESLVPGSNGFQMGSELGDVGVCVRTQQTYLPRIWPNRGVKRDCSVFGRWVNYSEVDPSFGGLQIIPGDATISTAGTYILTKGGAAAITVSAPAAGTQDGAILRIFAGSAQLHVITATGLLYTGAAQTGVITLVNQLGSGIVLMAYNAHWILVSNNGATLTS